MELVISVIVLVLCMMMFVLPATKKLELILFSCICLEPFSFSYVSFGACNKMLCLFFFLSEFKNYRKYLSALKGTMIGWLLLTVSLGTVILTIYSHHAKNPTTFLGLIVNDLLAKYFVLAYVFVAFRRTDSLKSFYNVVTIATVLLTVFGILNSITKVSLIAEITGTQGTDFANMDRTRIVGMFSYAFDYGFCCCVLSVFALYSKAKSIISTFRFRVIFYCSLFGIFICGCRSVIVVEAIMLLIYILMIYKPYKSFAIILLLSISFSVSYRMIPAVKEKTDIVVTAFDSDNQEMGESSLFMRALQFTTVISQIEGHELLGRGYRYFIEDLGYDKYGNGFRDLPLEAQTLMGLEGVAMNLMLERGYLGLAIYFVFYGGLVFFAYRRRKKTKIESVCAISILVGFVCFGNMTGELSSPVITLFATGLFLKLSVLQYPDVKLSKIRTHQHHATLSCNSNSGI